VRVRSRGAQAGAEGVVTFVSPVEVFVNGSRFFNRQKLSMVASSFSSECLDHLICRS